MSTKQAPSTRASFARGGWRRRLGWRSSIRRELAPGFRAGGAHCGLKAGGETDVAVLACDAPEVSSAILLTRNAAAAAPIVVCRDDLDHGAVRAVVVNSGNANAATGEQGYRDALAMRAPRPTRSGSTSGRLPSRRPA